MYGVSPWLPVAAVFERVMLFTPGPSMPFGMVICTVVQLPSPTVPPQSSNQASPCVDDGLVDGQLDRRLGGGIVIHADQRQDDIFGRWIGEPDVEGAGAFAGRLRIERGGEAAVAFGFGDHGGAGPLIGSDTWRSW